MTMTLLDEETLLKVVQVGAKILETLSRFTSNRPSTGSRFASSTSTHFSFRSRFFQPASTNINAQPINNNSHTSINSQIYNP